MNKLFGKLFRSSNKENDLNRTCGFNQSKRGRQPLRTQNYEEDDEPMNPYHAPSQPRRHRGPRSVAGGERLDDRFERHANRSFESEYHYREQRPSRSRRDYERKSQKKTTKHGRNQKTSEYGSGEASPARYHQPIDSDSENEDFGVFRDSKRVEQRFEELHDEIKNLRIENKQLLHTNEMANHKMRNQKEEIRQLKMKLKEARKELSVIKQMPPHFNHPQHHQFSRHSAAFDIPPPMSMNQSLFHPNMSSSMHNATLYRNGPPFCVPNQSYSPRAPSTSAAGAGESLANQSSQFMTNINPQVNNETDDGDELKVYREPEESSEINETVSYDDSITRATEDMRSATPEPLQFTPQISSSSLTLVEEDAVSARNDIAQFAKPQKRATVHRSLSFNN